MSTADQTQGPKGNSLLINREAEPPYVEKTYGQKLSGWRQFKFGLLRSLGRPVPVECQPAEARRDFESDVLQLWNQRNLRAPQLLTASSDVKEVTLRMQYCAGPTLDEKLRDDSLSVEEKLDVLSEVLRDMRWRHCAALVELEPRFVHPDANLRNTILTPEGPLCIDFEMGHTDESIERTEMRELKKFCLCSLEVLGAEHLPALAKRVFYDYGVHRIIDRLIDRTNKRAFAAWHQSRDARKKRDNPGLVTKVDLAKAIEAARINHWAQRKRVARNTDGLPAAEETSWDGRFYQSLDDSDPRGRDMPHRYEVMQFPEDFTGKSILDIGCNLGRICIDALERGATRSVGIDFRKDVMEAMNAHCQKAGINVELHAFDINDGLEALKKVIGDEPFDYVTALSIWSHVDPKKFWQIVDHFAASTFLLEDNYSSRIQSLPRMEELIRENLPGATIEFLGFTTDRGPRSIFRITR